jgi:hypothetical protein
MVGPTGSNWCKKFEESYIEVCKICNVKLGAPCPNFNKCFGKTKIGKVLGIWFRSSDLSWKLPDDKIFKTNTSIVEAIECKKLTLLQMQKLMGRLENIAIMCPFLKLFMDPLYRKLGWLQKNPYRTCVLDAQCIKDLYVFSGFLSDPNEWHPISPRSRGPPIVRIELTSDAAGLQKDENEKVGVAAIGLDLDGNIMFARRILWHKEFLLSKDSLSKLFGKKSTTLECFGMLLPFISIPSVLKNQHIVLKVDNIGCVYAMENFKSKDDLMASIIVKSIHLIAARLGSCIHVQHLPRLSNWEAELTDRMSRLKTSTVNDEKLLNSFMYHDFSDKLSTWLKNPTEYWDFALDLLEYADSLMY